MWYSKQQIEVVVFFFLKNITMNVVVEGEQSKSVIVDSGVPRAQSWNPSCSGAT